MGAYAMKALFENWFWHSCFTFLHLWNSVASGKFFFYTVNNPSMHYGGAFLDRKTTLLRQLREGWIPKGFSHTGTLDQLPKGIEFPVIAKPDKGVTGIGIKKCRSLDQLNAYLTAAGAMRVRIESFVDLPFEFGVMFYYHPRTKETEISIVEKRYPRVIGDGKLTLKTLIAQAARCNRKLRVEEIHHRLRKRLNEVPGNGEEIVLDYVGNGTNGSTFHEVPMVGNTENLRAFLVEELYVQAGICFTRMDVKAASLDALLAGDFILIEHNGVKSEPLQIFIKELPISVRYKYYKHHFRTMRRISQQQRALGHEPVAFLEGIVEFYRQRKRFHVIADVVDTAAKEFSS